IRLSSIDGAEVDDELFELLTSEIRMMPHVHLSLQHGHDLMLKRMKRRHSRRDAVALVERLKTRGPEIAIGADLIAGFPTEDEQMHTENRSIIRQLEIVHGHIFPYSARPGTPAARMPQVAAEIIRRRARELREDTSEVRAAWLRSLLGTPLRVLAERDGSGYAENFARVALAPGAKAGRVVEIAPTAIRQGVLA